MMISKAHIDEDAAWQQLLIRDCNADFFYAVATTGVFCRPNCGSRKPLRSNTRFFLSAAEARAAGFRACRRCRPEEPFGPSVVANMCIRLEQQAGRAVRLAELGKLAGISPFSAQRLFKQSMGVTPAQYQRSLRANALRNQLKRGANVTDAIYEAGYGSSSRAYEKCPLGMTPGRFISGGRGEEIRFATTACAGADSGQGLGWLIVASTVLGICWVALGDSAESLESDLLGEFPAATITRDPNLAQTLAIVLERIQGEAGGKSLDQKSQQNLPLDLRGTAFQLRVWTALQQIPSGETRSYSELAREMGNPAATRAVARACATNRVAIIVPCHRVVGISGSLTGYRWGLDRKRQLLAAERV